MKTFSTLLLLCVLCVSAAVAPGCGGMTVRAPTDAQMQADSQNAQATIVALAGVGTATQPATQPAGVAQAFLKTGGLALDRYYQASTANLFAYWFDKNKTILVNGTFSVDLSTASAFALEGAKRADGFTEELARRAAVAEALDIIHLNGVRVGAKP